MKLVVEPPTTVDLNFCSAAVTCLVSLFFSFFFFGEGHGGMLASERTVRSLARTHPLLSSKKKKKKKNQENTKNILKKRKEKNKGPGGSGSGGRWS